MGVLAAVAFAVSPLAAAAEAAGGPSHASGEGWELERKVDDVHEGYTLYARPRAGSDFAEYRLEVSVEGEPAEVIDALEHNMLDPKTYPEGFERTLLRRDERVVVTYDYIAVPFLSDRDVVMRTEIVRDARPGEPCVRWSAIEGEGPPPRDGVVRMPSSHGTWTLTPDGSRTLAVYQSHVDLGGSVPASLVESRLPAEIAEQAVNLRRTMRDHRIARR